MLVNTSNKTKAIDFLLQCSRGESRNAFEQYASSNIIHHNAYFPADPKVLMQAMEDNAKRFPEMTFTIQRAIVEGDIVAVHSKAHMEKGDRGYAIMHILRFVNDKIVELWDFGQPVPEDMPNENGMF